MTLASLTAEEIQLRLEGNHFPAEPENPFPPDLLEGEPTPAAVLIPLLQMEQAWHILFIRRTVVDGDYHSGQVAFPGGRSDPGDTTPEDTALRETSEEVGIRPQDVHVLGRLREIITISNYRVTPVVGVIPWPSEITIAVEEVSRAFSIPLAWLLEGKNRSEVTRDIPGEAHRPTVIYFKEYDGELLWGLSARIMVNFLEALSSDPKK